MTVIDLVTYGPLLQQLDALDRDLADQRRYTEQLRESLALALQRQQLTATTLAALRGALRATADEHGRVRLAAGDLHRREERSASGP